MAIVESELLQAAHIELVEELHKAGKDGSIRLKFCILPIALESTPYCPIAHPQIFRV